MSRPRHLSFNFRLGADLGGETVPRFSKGKRPSPVLPGALQAPAPASGLFDAYLADLIPKADLRMKRPPS